MVYPFAGTPYASAFDTCGPNAVLYEDAELVIVSYLMRAIFELDVTAPCCANCGLLGL